MNQASIEDFVKIELISGTVVKAEEFARAKKPAFKVWVDFGEKVGVLQTSAQVTKHYTIDGLIGKSVMGCVNLGERNIAGFISQFLLVGFGDENENIILAVPDKKVPNGKKLC